MENLSKQTEIAANVMYNLRELLENGNYHKLHTSYGTLTEADKNTQTAIKNIIAGTYSSAGQDASMEG